MTEKEWITGANPVAFLVYFLSDRKLRLLGAACIRRHYDKLPNDIFLRTANAVDGVADNPSSYYSFDELKHDIRLLQHEIRDSGLKFPYHVTMACLALTRQVHWDGIKNHIADTLRYLQRQDVEEERSAQIKLIKDFICNPFRPVTLDPSWQTTTVTDLARCIYDNRAFDLMPILADALDDARCDNQDILQHCRGDGPHVKGCWVVDLILGKE